MPRARGGNVRTEKARCLWRLCRELEYPGRAEGRSLTRDAQWMVAASTHSTASRKGQNGGGYPASPSLSCRTAHRPPRHPSSLPLSLFTAPSFLPAPHLHLHSSQPEPGLGPPPTQHTFLATRRPTCRRGHFSTGPRLQLFKEEMSFRFSLSRVPALLSFP